MLNIQKLTVEHIKEQNLDHIQLKENKKTLEAMVNSERWHDRYYNVECVETGERFSQSLLAKQLNIPRHKLKPLIVKEENINGKHYKFIKR